MEDVTTINATPQRPEGYRVVDAVLTEIDLDKFIEDLKNESTWNDSDRNSITVHKSDNFVMVLIGLHKAAEMKPHNAKGILSLQVLQGRIRFVIEQKNTEMKKGSIVVLHENIFHSITAEEESFLLLTIADTEGK